MEIKEFLKNIFSITDYGQTHHKLTFWGIKIKYPRWEYYLKKKRSIFYYYKKHNKNITELPPATGQIRDIQLANLALLNELDYVCHRAGLTYWLDGGTLLGAVRHKGFIPWDDDIDTAMLREDYEKLIDAFEKYSRDSDIYVDYHRSKIAKNMRYLRVLHRKSSHLFVDVFPWDTYGDILSEREQLAISANILKFLKNFKKTASKLSDFELKTAIRDIMKTKYLKSNSNKKGKDSDYVWGIDFNHPFDNWFWRYDVLYPLKTIAFEGYEFPCLNKEEEFLTRLYKDYMAYPNSITMGHSMFLNLSKEELETIKSLAEKNKVRS